MTATSPIERVVLTHLQIPLKESFRISGGEVAIKDAILVTAGDLIGHRAGGELADGRGLRVFDRHPGGMLGRPGRRDSPEPGRQGGRLSRGHRRDRVGLERLAVRRRRGRDRALGSAWPGPLCDHRRAPGGHRRAGQPGGAVGPGRRAFSLDRRDAEDHRDPPRRRLSPREDQDPAGQRRRACPRGPSALRRDPSHGRRQWGLHRRGHRGLPPARRVRPADVRAADGSG